ncbi:MAG: YncE family protein, partial [Gemmatimonadaceae bacterium]
ASAVRMAITSTGSRVFVQMSNSRLAIVDVASRSLTADVPVGDTALVMRVASGDSLLYLGMKAGDVLEVSTTSGSVRRKFKAIRGVVDLFIAPDGKTLVIAGGTTSIQVVALVPGARDETINFDDTETLRIYAVGVTPDGSQLWAAATGDLPLPVGNAIFVARFQTADGVTQWNGALVGVPAANANRILFDATGGYAIVQDDGANQVVAQNGARVPPRVLILR